MKCTLLSNTLVMKKIKTKMFPLQTFVRRVSDGWGKNGLQLVESKWKTSNEDSVGIHFSINCMIRMLLLYFKIEFFSSIITKYCQIEIFNWFTLCK